MLSIVSLALTLLQVALDAAIKNKLADQVIDGIRAAIEKLLEVQNTPVTYGQLESLRVEMPDWAPKALAPAPAPTTPPETPSGD